MFFNVQMAGDEKRLMHEKMRCEKYMSKFGGAFLFLPRGVKIQIFRKKCMILKISLKPIKPTNFIAVRDNIGVLGS